MLKKTTDSLSNFQIYTNLIQCYTAKHNDQKVIECLEKQTQYLPQTTQNKFHIWNEKQKGFFYLSQKQYSKALVHLQKAEDIAINLKQFKELKNIIETKLSLYKELGKTKELNELYESIFYLNNEINRINEENQGAKVLLKMQTQDLEKEKQIQEIKLKSNKMHLHLIIMIASILLLGSVIVIFLLRQRTQHLQKLVEINKESILKNTNESFIKQIEQIEEMDEIINDETIFNESENNKLIDIENEKE